MAPRYLVTVVALVAVLAAAVVARLTITTLGIAWCADACGGHALYYDEGECECAEADHPAYGR